MFVLNLTLNDANDGNDCQHEKLNKQLSAIPILQTDDPLLLHHSGLNYIYGVFGNNETLQFNEVAIMLLNITNRKYQHQNDLDHEIFELSCDLQNILSSLTKNQTIMSPQHFMDACPYLLQILSMNTMGSVDNPINDEINKITTTEIWCYGFLAVTIISLCSLVGISVLPIMHKPIYDKVLLGLICLAVGTLSGNAIFQLIPEGFEIQNDEKTVWRSAIICSGVYLFV